MITVMEGEKQLYFHNEELEIPEEEPDNILYSKIKEHEFSGLENIGCQVSRLDGYVEVSSDVEKGAYYNRIVECRLSSESFSALLDKKQQEEIRHSFVLDSFTRPESAEQLLADAGATHTLSTVVLGRETEKQEKAGNVIEKYSYIFLDLTDMEQINSLIDTFHDFYRRSGETNESVQQRMLSTIQTGEILAVLDGNRIIGSVSASIFNDTAALFSLIVDENYRRSYIFRDMRTMMEKELTEKGVTFGYLKTKNKAVYLSAKEFFGFSELYNERVYEL